MAKITNQSVPVELQPLYSAGVVNRSARGVDSAGRKIYQDSRRLLTKLQESNLLIAAAEAWNSLDQSVRDQWNSLAGVFNNNYTGYNYFAREYCTRYYFDFSLPPPFTSPFHYCVIQIKAGTGLFELPYYSVGQNILYSSSLSVDFSFDYRAIKENPALSSKFKIRMKWDRPPWPSYDNLYTEHEITVVDGDWHSVNFTAESPDPDYVFSRFEFYDSGNPFDLFLDNILLFDNEDVLFNYEVRTYVPLRDAVQSELYPYGLASHPETRGDTVICDYYENLLPS